VERTLAGRNGRIENNPPKGGQVLKFENEKRIGSPKPEVMTRNFL